MFTRTNNTKCLSQYLSSDKILNIEGGKENIMIDEI